MSEAIEMWNGLLKEVREVVDLSETCTLDEVQTVILQKLNVSLKMAEVAEKDYPIGKHLHEAVCVALTAYQEIIVNNLTKRFTKNLLDKLSSL